MAKGYLCGRRSRLSLTRLTAPDSNVLSARRTSRRTSKFPEGSSLSEREEVVRRSPTLTAPCMTSTSPAEGYERYDDGLQAPSEIVRAISAKKDELNGQASSAFGAGNLFARAMASNWGRPRDLIWIISPRLAQTKQSNNWEDVPKRLRHLWRFQASLRRQKACWRRRSIRFRDCLTQHA